MAIIIAKKQPLKAGRHNTVRSGFQQFTIVFSTNNNSLLFRFAGSFET